MSESDRGKLVDSALSSIVTQTATNLLNQQLGEQFIGGVFVGMNELGDGIGEAADGATALADGGSQLADGAGQLADGTEQLATGTGQLANGAAELSGGAGELSSGASELSNGAAQLADGASGVAGGASSLSNGTQLFVYGDGSAANPGLQGYVAGAQELSAQYQGLSDGTVATANQLKTMIAALGQLQADSAAPGEQLSGGLGAAGAGLATLAGDGTPANPGDIGRLYGECLASGAAPAFCDDMLSTLQSRAGEIGGGLQTAGTGAAGLQTANANFAATVGAAGSGAAGDPSANLDALIAGSTAFGAGLGEYASAGTRVLGGAEQLASGASALSGGAAQLSSGTAGLSAGASALSSGTSQLASGASQLSSGTSELAANTPELAEGASQLADGADASADGAGELADGLGDAEEQIPSYSESEREELAHAAVAPVETRGGSSELFNASGVPLFVGIALWAGALATFLVLSPLWRRTHEAARGIGSITLRSALPAIGLGALQGAIAGVILPAALGYDLGQAARFFGLAVLVGVAFLLVVQGLSALLGGLGRFVAFALLVVAFAVGVVSTVPASLAAVSDASPLGAALDGFQAVASGGAGTGSTALLLVLWGLAGVTLTALGVARARRSGAQ